MHIRNIVTGDLLLSGLTASRGSRRASGFSGHQNPLEGSYESSIRTYHQRDRPANLVGKGEGTKLVIIKINKVQKMRS